MTDPAETPISFADLIELSRLVEQDGITSDVLPAYVQALLTVRLMEPDYCCRRAAVRLSVYNPPLSPQILAMALRAMAREVSDVPNAAPETRLGFRGFLARFRRFWRLKLI